jgi:chromosome segregation ATPase
MDDMRLELKKFDRLNDSLRRELDFKNHSLEKLKHDSSLALSENDELKVQIRRLEQDVLKFDKINGELRVFCSQKNQQLSHLNSDIDSYKSSISSLKNELARLQLELKKFSTLVDDEKRKSGPLAAKLSERMNEVSAIKQLIISKNKEISDYSSKSAVFEQKLAVFERQNRSLLEELDVANASIAKLKKVIMERNHEMADREVSYSRMLRESKGSFDGRLDELGKSQAEREVRLRAEIGVLKDALEDKQRLIDEKDRKMKDMLRSLNERVRELVYVEPEESKPSSVSSASDELFFLVESALEKGDSEQRIISSLESSGFRKSEIKEAIRKIRK